MSLPQTEQTFKWEIQAWDDIDHEWAFWDDVTCWNNKENPEFLEAMINDFFENHQGYCGSTRKMKFRLVKITTTTETLETKTVQIEEGRKV